MRIKLLLTFSLLLVFRVLCYGTGPGRRGVTHRSWSNTFVGASIGLGTPVSSFAKTDTTDAAGYAKPGIHLNICGGVKLMPYFGLMAMVGGSLNGFNVDKYSNHIILDSSASNPTYTAKPYILSQFLFGPFIYFSDGQNYNLMLKAMVGLGTVKFPVIEQSITTPTTSQTTTVETPSSKGFTYVVGAGLNYKLTDRIGILVGLDYYGSTITYVDRKTTTEAVFQTNPVITASSLYVDPKKYKLSVGLLNLTAGVTLNF